MRDGEEEEGWRKSVENSQVVLFFWFVAELYIKLVATLYLFP
jgi:hypothetical protein